jgi:predicted dithiol-disulfide oxidoreductase (DUF899 family)
MSPTEVVSRAEWDVAREALLANEKKLTRARDALAAERRRLPMGRTQDRTGSWTRRSDEYTPDELAGGRA